MADTDNTATETTNAIAQADAAAEAEQDAVLAKILSGDNAEPSNEPPGDRARDEHGRFSSSKEKAEKPEAKTAETPESKALPEGVKAEDYRKALKALQFDTTPQKVIDSLDPSEVIEWGLKRSKNHADVERLKADLIKAKALQTKATAEATSESSEPDWSKLIEPVAKKFSDDFSVDMSEPLKAFAKQLAETVSASNQAKLQEQQAVIDAIQGQFRSQQQEAARAKLSEKYDLDKDERWQRVLEHRQADKNEYASEHDAIQAACRHEFAEEIIANYEAKLKEQHKLRSNGQPTAEHKKTPPKAMSQEDVENQILGHILDGNHEAAARLGRRSQMSASEMMAMQA